MKKFPKASCSALAVLTTASIGSALALPMKMKLPTDIQERLNNDRVEGVRSLNWNQCSDLSGSWQGECSDSNGDTTFNTIRIAQNRCDTVRFYDPSGEEVFSIGGYNSEQAAQAWGYVSDWRAVVDWNSQRRGLNFRITGTGRKINGDYFFNGNASGEFDLISPTDLRSYFKSSFVIEEGGGTNVSQNWEACSYTKK